MMSTLDKMVEGYLEAALWSTCANVEDNEEGHTWFDLGYEVSDVSEAGLAQAKKDCEAFLEAAIPLITEDERKNTARHSWESYLGHNFWLTRERHGAGFWDGCYENGKGLTELCRPYGNGSDSMFLNDDGEIDL